MYEEYLEDHVYKLMAKFATRICRLFKSDKKTVANEAESSLVEKPNTEKVTTENVKAIEGKGDSLNEKEKSVEEDENDKKKEIAASSSVVPVPDAESKVEDTKSNCDERRKKRRRSSSKDGGDEDELNNINFHMMLFFMWMSVTLVNLPALLTWARNFK